jgi:hypothetical protein
MTSGYSGAPLVDKLGYKDGMRVWFHAMPDAIRAEIFAAGLTVSEEEVPTAGTQAAHIFVSDKTALAEKLESLRKLIDPTGFIWVSWPTESSGIETDITDDSVRDIISTDNDLVEIESCDVGSMWSGLKLMIRQDRR